MKLYLITSYLYCVGNDERDTECTVGIASSPEKAKALIEEWTDFVMKGEDAYKDLEELESDSKDVKTYYAIDEFGDKWFVDLVIRETELDKVL